MGVPGPFPNAGRGLGARARHLTSKAIARSALSGTKREALARDLPTRTTGDCPSLARRNETARALPSLAMRSSHRVPQADPLRYDNDQGGPAAE